ncbi:MAG: transaldolase [Pseudomonadota bacterium]
MSSLLEQLKRHSVVVADTGELAAIRRYQPEDATTNPSLVLKSIQAGEYPGQVDAALRWALDHDSEPALTVEKACDRLAVAMGAEILRAVPGRISTEVPAALSFDSAATLAKARQLCAHYRDLGVAPERVLIKIAATWEGIQAARQLEQDGVRCNLTLIFSAAQARACAEAGVYLISPFVGRILDWHRRQEPQRDYAPMDEPGVRSVIEIQRYFQRHGYPTLVMGASFRNLGEILALAGCDRLTIGPALLEDLASQAGELRPGLADDGQRAPRPAPLDEARFRWQLNQDAMATEKLAEGIRGFHADQQRLEALVEQHLRQLRDTH